MTGPGGDMKVLKPGRTRVNRTWMVTCGNCAAELEVTVHDLRSARFSSQREPMDSYHRAICICPECHQTVNIAEWADLESWEQKTIMEGER